MIEIDCRAKQITPAGLNAIQVSNLRGLGAYLGFKYADGVLKVGFIRSARSSMKSCVGARKTWACPATRLLMISRSWPPAGASTVVTSLT